jgi:hypothetical protein
VFSNTTNLYSISICAWWQGFRKNKYRCFLTYNGPKSWLTHCKSKLADIGSTFNTPTCQTSYFDNTIACSVLAHPHYFVADLQLWFSAAASHWESITPHIISPGKDQDSKFEILFLLNMYDFYSTTKLKNYELNKLL